MSEKTKKNHNSKLIFLTEKIKINYDFLSFSCNPNTQALKVCKRPRK